MVRHVFSILGILLFMVMQACQEVESPINLTPRIEILEAEDITRNSALLSCKIEKIGMESVSMIRCYYGLSQTSMYETIDCNPSLSKVQVNLTNLQSNTTYYYYFELGNGYSTVKSSIYSFITSPDQSPTVGELQLLGKGPTSIMLQFDLVDDGGQALISSGFYLQAEGGEESRLVVGNQDNVFYARLGNLRMQTKYTVQGFAVNAIGETKTEKLHFQTKQVVEVVKAGTLKDVMDKEERWDYSQLAVSGPLNGTDIRVLREMLGRDQDGLPTAGRMSTLDLTDAAIVSGGESYDGNHYTKQNVVGRGMFADCLFLENIKLPYELVEIEGGAFENCEELDSLYIPKNVVRVATSKGCVRLKGIEVAKDNLEFASFDGCLYSHDNTSLYWYPEGKVQDSISFPNNLKCIRAYAFQNTQITEIEIPYTVEELGVGTFYAAKLKAITIPDKVTIIPTGLFQDCNRLSSVWLGQGITFLSAYCFDGTPIEHLYVPIKDYPPICSDEAFIGAEYLFESCVLHVPVGCKNLYQGKKGWTNFKYIQDDIAG